MVTAACACRLAVRPLIPSGGISTTKALLPGNVCVSQVIAVPRRPLPLQLVRMPTSLAYSTATCGLP
jgi:hypothetical protein